MKSNSKKHRGFGLIEVVISIAILSIISIAVYEGCIIIVRQIKAGEVKQVAALEGKKIIEEMQAADFEIPSGDESLEIGNNIDLQKEEKDGSVFYTRYLNENYSECAEDVSKYVEKITLNQTDVELNTNDESHSIDNKLYISRIDSKDYMRYWEYDTDEQYTPDKSDISTVLIPSNSEKIEISVYFTSTDTGNQKIEICDFRGKDLVTIDKEDEDDKDLVINFSNYIDSNGAVPSDVEIELNIYNKTTDTPKIYIEKSQKLKVNVEARKGRINIYDNRAEDAEESNIGILYDFKIEISDYLKYKNDEINEDKDNLFTGYYKKNMK